jgi:hypothetical protein
VTGGLGAAVVVGGTVVVGGSVVVVVVVEVVVVVVGVVVEVDDVVTGAVVEVSLPPEHATATSPVASTSARTRERERFIRPMLGSLATRRGCRTATAPGSSIGTVVAPRTDTARWASLPA